jgi:hypothetical protein
MAVPDERLVLEASVVDDFTDTLTDLSEALLEVDRLASQTVEDINADVNIDDALRDLGFLGAGLDAVDDDPKITPDVEIDEALRDLATVGGAADVIDDDVTFDAEVDTDLGDGIDDIADDPQITPDVEIDEALRDLATLDRAVGAVDDDIKIDVDLDSDLTDEIDDIGDVFDSDGNLQTPSIADPAADVFNSKMGSGATADGGGGDTSVLGADDIERFREAFGEAFDPSAIFSDRQPQRGIELLDGGVGDFIDQDAALSEILDGNLDVDVLEDFAGLDPDDTLDALDELQDAGVTNLPTGLTDRFRNLELKMGDFFRIFAALIPLLAVFIGALPAAISGIVALGGAALAAAGALAGVGGLALLSGVLTADGEVDTSQLTERIEELFDEATAELGPVAQQFAPLLDESFQTVEDTIADIADRVGVFRRVVGDAEGALQYLEETVPVAMADIVRFGDAAMPIIAGVIREAGNMGILRAFADLIVRMGPNLATLTKLFVGLLPAIIQLSQGFLYVATFLTGFLYAIGRLIDVVPYAGQIIGVMTGALLTLVSATALYTITQSGAIAATIGLTKSVLSAAAAFIGKYTVGVFSAIAGTYGFTTALISATVAAATLIGVLTLGLGPVLGFLSGGFTDLSSDIDKATSSLESFASASDSLDGTQVGVNGGMGATGAGGASGGYQDASQITVVAGDKETGNAVANQLAFSSIGGQLGESSVNNRRHGGT